MPPKLVPVTHVVKAHERAVLRPASPTPPGRGPAPLLLIDRQSESAVQTEPRVTAGAPLSI